MKARTTNWVAIVAIILLGAALRLHDLNRMPLRGDEAFTVIHWVREPLSSTFDEIALRDPQPPLAYILYHVWGILVGTGEQTARFLPALLNILGIPALYALGKRIHSRRVGLFTAFIWALHPFQIWHAQDARNYAIWGAFTAVSLWVALRAVQRGRRVDWILYVVGAVISAYVYYLELFVVAALNLFVFAFYWRDRRVLGKWILSQVAIALILAPWFLQSRLLFGSGYGGTAGRFEPLELLTWFVPTLMFGETLPLELNGFVVLIGVFAVALGITVLWRKSRPIAALLVLLVGVPFVGIALVSTRLNVFVPRYVLSVSVPFALAMGLMLQHRWRRVALALASFVVTFVIVSLSGYYFDYTKSPDWRALTEFLHQNTGAADYIINTSADEAFTFYHAENGVDAGFVRLPANPQQSASEIERELAHLSTDYANLWVVADTPADWENRDIVPAWLNENLQLVYSARANGMRILQYAPTLPDSGEVSQPARAAFSDAVSLLDMTIVSPPDGWSTLSVQLVWQVNAPTETSLKSFVHLIGPFNPAAGTPLWSQDDQFPEDGALDSTTWEPGLIYREVYELSLEDVPAGTYTLVTGWYDPLSGDRLQTGDQDAFMLEPYVIE